MYPDKRQISKKLAKELPYTGVAVCLNTSNQIVPYKDRGTSIVIPIFPRQKRQCPVTKNSNIDVVLKNSAVDMTWATEMTAGALFKFDEEGRVIPVTDEKDAEGATLEPTREDGGVLVYYGS